MMRHTLLILTFFLSLSPLKSQELPQFVSNFYRQLQQFPQEKVYLMTDKAAYVAGEQIWFRAFLTDAITHRQDIPKSRYVYVDLIDPDGNILKHHQIRPDSNGVFHNRIELADDMAEGAYLLRAYTMYMQSCPDYLFEKRVFIADPMSPHIAVEPDFTITKERKISVSFRFRDLKDNSFLTVKSISIQTGATEPQEFPARSTISLQVNPQTDKHLMISFAHGARQYRKYIPIPYPQDTPFDVSFFPEGGYLLNDVPAKVGFKALRSDGLSEQITGEVYDSDGQHIATLQTLHAGMGSFFLLPQAGKSYYALCTAKDTTLRFELPAVEPNGCALQVMQRGEEYVITAHDRRAAGRGDLFLIVHIRGMVYYADYMPPNHRVTLLSGYLPAGVIQVLLLDKEMNPLSERLLFNRQFDFAKAELTPDRSDYGKRMPVKVDIRLDLPQGFDSNGFFTVSVTDDSDILPDTTTTLISSLLLSSELRGHIEDAGYYLSNDPAASVALDALLLTQGWRRYDIPSVAKGIIEEPSSYIEAGKEFSGSVKMDGLFGGPVQDASVFTIIPSMNIFHEEKTDKMGMFRTPGFEFPDSTLCVIQAFVTKNRILALTLDPEPELPPAHAIKERERERDLKFNDYVTKADKKFVDEQGLRSYEIPEVVVTAKREGISIYSNTVSATTVRDEIIELYQTDINMILQLTPGLVVRPDGSIYLRSIIEGTFTYMGSNNYPALIVLDDIVLGRGSPDYENINIQELSGLFIKRIEILPPPFSGVLGYGGTMGGAILITTDKKGVAQKILHLAKLTPLGYKKAAQFYAPRYETNAQRNSYQRDLRTTIHWQPDVQIVDGTATIQFYTADASKTTYSIVLEGITTDGTIIRQIGQISRNKE